MFTDNGPVILAEIEGGGELDERSLSTIQQPTLLVSAADSDESFRHVNERLAAMLPNADELRVGGGHVIDPAHPENLRFVERYVARAAGGSAARRKYDPQPSGCARA